MQNSEFEILAPAGNQEMLRAAVFSGADCVYIGISGFNARRGAANFEGQTLLDAVAFCYARNCKVYAALNTVVLPGEEDALRKAVQQVCAAGCDAVIVQDLATANMVKSMAPFMPLHASTQMSIHSLAGVYTMAKLGFSRVILARELSEKEIAYIAAQTPIELEVFVHGALCVCVSGQCYMSAFLGGRSANRGACAGTCRLPFAAHQVSASQKSNPPAKDQHHLSLKDLSILDALPRLQEMGVCSAKIEGRLRGPEFCAVVVDSARKSLNAEKYDKELLQKVFSRSGFTDAWFRDNVSNEMVGIRTEEDTASARKALPQTRELYRREAPRVPVDIHLLLQAEGGTLTITDGTHALCRDISPPLVAAQKPADLMLCTALQKTGGTPFFAREIKIATNGLHFAANAAGILRREMLEELLQLRQAAPPFAAQPALPRAISLPVQAFSAGKHRLALPSKKPRLRARFEHVGQLLHSAKNDCREYIFPVYEAEQVPPNLRTKSWLWLPRALFGAEESRVLAAIEKTKKMGFKGYEVQNLAHLSLCDGLPLSGGFGLNATNALSASILAAVGCERLTLSPELSLHQMKAIAKEADMTLPQLDALCYGHMPVMLTRACPLHNVVACSACASSGVLTDRKGTDFPVLCGQGVRSIYNPIPLWMADRLAELPTHSATLYFTNETPAQAKAILAAFAAGQTAPGTFTRGLYDKGVSE